MWKMFVGGGGGGGDGGGGVLFLFHVNKKKIVSLRGGCGGGGVVLAVNILFAFFLLFFPSPFSLSLATLLRVVSCLDLPSSDDEIRELYSPTLGINPTLGGEEVTKWRSEVIGKQRTII